MSLRTVGIRTMPNEPQESLSIDQSYAASTGILNQHRLDLLPIDILSHIFSFSILKDKDIMNFELINLIAREKTEVLYEAWLRRTCIGFTGIVHHYKQISWKELYKERSSRIASCLLRSKIIFFFQGPKVDSVCTSHSATVYDLKKSIADKLRVPVSRLRLYYQTKLIDDSDNAKSTDIMPFSYEFSVEVQPSIEEASKKADSNFQNRGISTFDSLFDDTVWLIFKMVIRSPADSYQLSLVCSSWKRLAQSDEIWAPLVELRFSEEAYIKKMNWTKIHHHYTKIKPDSVFIKSSSYTLHLRVRPKYDTIGDVKQEIFRRKGISIDTQKIIFAGIGLEDHRFLWEYSIANQSSCHLVIAPRKSDH